MGHAKIWLIFIAQPSLEHIRSLALDDWHFYSNDLVPKTYPRSAFGFCRVSNSCIGGVGDLRLDLLRSSTSITSDKIEPGTVLVAPSQVLTNQ
jgi:hypothetical protein